MYEEDKKVLQCQKISHFVFVVKSWCQNDYKTTSVLAFAHGVNRISEVSVSTTKTEDSIVLIIEY